ncbi:MAG: PorV/PorQ family protein [Stygiobacter sp.]
MKKILFIYFAIISLVLPQSQNESGYAFLKNGFTARNIAMGEFGAVGINDLSALHYNPSYLALNNKTQLAFSHHSLFNDYSSENFGFSFNLFNLPFAIGINTTKIDGIELRTKPGELIAKFNANYFYASLSSAYQIKNFYFGATIKYLYENIYIDDSNGYAFDFGFNYEKFYDNFSLGVVIKNIGNVNELKNIKTKLPLDFQIGINYNYKYDDFEFNPIIGYQNYLTDKISHLHFGTEIKYNQTVSLRLGYVSNYDSKNITTGLGVVFKKFNIDYAYVPIKYGLGDNHILTLIYNF